MSFIKRYVQLGEFRTLVGMTESPDMYEHLRAEMVKAQVVGRGISDEAVIAAMQQVPRHLFVPEHLRAEAYEDKPLPLGPDQTISQPYIVALMLETLRLTSADSVLEVGTGSGYQTALLSEIVGQVYSIELDPGLSAAASRLLKQQGCDNVKFRSGNGWRGWVEQGPFDAIIVSAAAFEIPRDLVKQLKMGGRMVVPIGEQSQCLVFLEKTEQGLISQELGAVRFVPLKDEDSHH
ncbi:MAG: protein-L-isoaspartate(D-aspartate) O-methyltransferase [Oligoflexia bacterium]|nr:protein-L-isoaspartate(D-aspartate) O-methyltransferase [Oligoflexia bacterium]